MQRKQKLVGARSLHQRNGRTLSAKIPYRANRKGSDLADDDTSLSPEWIKEINRRVRDSRDPVRYMLVSEFSRKFILYYDVSTDTFAMNNPSRGTLFKRREVVESVKDHLGQGIALVKFTVKGGRLKRLSPFRGMKLRRRSANRIHRNRLK
jgi:hypothetical protein